MQCCGEAHLSNFGGFATPERKIIFSINDLDETLPAPWGSDVNRLAASFVIACRDNGLTDATAIEVVKTCIRTYLSHARSGYANMISGYLGKSDAFDQAIAVFSKSYPDQNEKDHAALARAVKRGKIKAVFEEE